MLIGDQASANTFPYIHCQQMHSAIEHEASTCRISEDQLFYFQSRGIDPEAGSTCRITEDQLFYLQSWGIAFEEAVSKMVSGFCQDVYNQLPMEFAAEADKLLGLRLEGSVG